MESLLTYECVFGAASILIALASGHTSFTLLEVVSMTAACMAGKLAILYLQRPVNMKRKAA